jgi:hypothetical protein
VRDVSVAAPMLARMNRPTKFEEFRWVGDKRTQTVYDVDNLEDASIIDELVEAETYIGFAPDTLAEARNRCYKPYKRNGSGRPDVDVT